VRHRKGPYVGPQLLLVDELSLGTRPRGRRPPHPNPDKDSFRKKRLTVLLVDQDVQTALQISKRGYVIDNGRIVLEKESETAEEMIRRLKRLTLGL